jgi:hypothetical protein
MLSELLIAALIAVESGGNIKAVGDNGKAVGILQIHPEVVKDCNTILGKKIYRLDDRYFKIKSINMANVYLAHYCSEHRLGRKPLYKDFALCWHYGPMGPWMRDKDHYWDKVLEELLKRAEAQ